MTTDVRQLFGQAEGFDYIALTEPATKKSFHRVAWAQFMPGVDVEAVVRQLDGQKVRLLFTPKRQLIEADRDFHLPYGRERHGYR